MLKSARSIKVCLFAFFVLFYCSTNSLYVNWGGGDSPCWVLSVAKTQIPDFYRLPGYEENFFYRSNDYPLFTLLGKGFSAMLPGNNTAYKINTMVAILGGAAVFMVFLVLLGITSSWSAALAGSLALLFSHHFWLESNLGEVYTLHFFIITVIIYSLMKWLKTKKNRFLYLFSLSLALGLAHHALILIIIPAVVVFFLLNLRSFPGDIRVYGFCLLIFLLPLLILNSVSPFMISGSKGFLANLSAYIKSMLSLGSVSMHGNLSIREIVKYPAYLFYQFPFAGFFLGILGFFSRSIPRSLKIFLVTYYLSSVILPSTYLTGMASIDRPTFYISSYLVFSIFIGPGFLMLLDSRAFKTHKSAFRTAVFILIVSLPLCTYAAAPFLVKNFNIDIGRKNYLKYRDFERYFLFPPKILDSSAQRFGVEAFKVLEPNAVVYASYTPQYALIYRQFLLKNRWDVNIFNADLPNNDVEYTKSIIAYVRGWLNDFPVYLVPYTMLSSKEIGGLKLEPAGPLYRFVDPRQERDGGPFASEKNGARAVAPDGFDPEEMVLIPAAELNMEQVFGRNFSDYISRHYMESEQIKALLKLFSRAFYIDKYEVTAAQFCAFLNKFGNEGQIYMGEDDYANIVKKNGKYFPRSSPNLPANNVTVKGAANFASWKGKRLPYEIEWERAATNNYSTDYPWGDSDINAGLSNYHKRWTGSDFRVYAPVYGFTKGDDRWGVRQLLGNVMEWTAKMNFSLVSGLEQDPEFSNAVANRKRMFDKGYLLKGGGWHSYSGGLEPLRSLDLPVYIAHNSYAGFRCAKDPGWEK